MAGNNLNTWEAESFRLSVFFVDFVVSENLNFWEQLTGQSPNDKLSHPKQKRLRESGPFDNGILSMDLQRSRCDWVWQPDTTKDVNKPLTLGLYEDIENSFTQLMLKWLEISPQSYRIAYGNALLLDAANNTDANEKLNGLLPAVNIDTNDTYDFLYRINRRTDIQIEDKEIAINRLATWSVVQVINVTPGVPADGRLHHLPSEESLFEHFCRMELDFNTVSGYPLELIQEYRKEIFSELASLAKKTIELGDLR